MKKLLLIILLSSCKNDAITYAKAAYPGASCNAIITSYYHSEVDSAVCTWRGIVMTCDGSSWGEFECKKLRDMDLQEQHDRMYPCPQVVSQ